MRIWGVIIVAVWAVPVLAGSPFDSKFKFDLKNDYTTLFSPETIVELSLLANEKPIVTSNVSITARNADQSIEFLNAWPEGEYRAFLDQHLRFKKSIRLENAGTTKVKVAYGNKIVEMPYNRREVHYSTEKNEIEITYWQDDQQLTSHTLGVNENGIDIDLIGLYFQSRMLAKKPRSFNVDIIIPEIKRSLNVDIKYQTIKNLEKTSPEYEFPDQVKEISELPEEWGVFTLQAAGLAKLFYGHKFYLFFEKEAPYRLVAWWGGEPKKVMFFVASSKI